MTNRGAAVLGLRLFALYLVARVVLDAPDSYAQLAGRGDPGGAVLTAALAVLLPLAAALLIWVYVGRIANWVLPPRRPQSMAAAPSADPGQLAVLAYTVVGFLLLGEALPGLLGRLATEGLEKPLTPELVSGGVAVGMGLLLVLGARNLSQLVSRLRRAGAASGPDPRQEDVRDGQ